MNRLHQLLLLWNGSDAIKPKQRPQLAIRSQSGDHALRELKVYGCSVRRRSARRVQWQRGAYHSHLIGRSDGEGDLVHLHTHRGELVRVCHKLRS